MDECGLCLAHNSVKALHTISGGVEPFWCLIVFQFDVNIILVVGDAIVSSTKKYLEVWCMIECECHSIYLHFITTIAHHGA
jgi:short subunit fatty acids transporter